MNEDSQEDSQDCIDSGVANEECVSVVHDDSIDLNESPEVIEADHEVLSNEDDYV